MATTQENKSNAAAKARAAAQAKRAAAKEAKIVEEVVNLPVEPTEEDIVKAQVKAKEIAREAEQVKAEEPVVEVKPEVISPTTVVENIPRYEIVELSGGKCELRHNTDNGYKVLCKASREKCQHLLDQI